MPPKKKGRNAAAATEQPPAAVNPLALTVDGVERLRALSQHRPQRLAVGGFHLASAAALQPVPPPVTLQIVQINRYFVDHRFWPLVGVAYPELPAANGRPEPRADYADDMIINGEDGGPMTAAALAPSAATAAVAAPNAPNGFDQYSDLHVAHDLILSDGRFQLKVVLSPTLALHLEKGGLLQYGIIQVLESSVRYDETVVSGPGFHLIKQINILADQTNDLILTDPATPLSFPPWVSASDMANKPLIGGPRSYYLSLFNDDTIIFDESNYPPHGEAERIDTEQKQLLARAEPILMDEDDEKAVARASSVVRRQQLRKRAVQDQMQDSRLEEPVMLMRSDVVTIKQLLASGPGYQHGDKSIVCRIFAKSRILNFGRKSGLGKADMLRAPFSFDLLVGDESDEQIKVVLWNTLVGAYFGRVQVGQVVAIRGFRLKRARSDQQFELALNPYNPIGSIRVLEGANSVERSVGEHIPPLTVTVSSIAVIKTMPDDSYFDVCGVITYAGPMLREWSQPKKQFYQYRWLLLVDPSCTDALSVKVYTNSQQAPLEDVRVADVLYLTNLTLHSTNAASEVAPTTTRSIVAKSSNYTHLIDQSAQAHTGHPYLLQLIKWSQEVNHGDLALYPSLYIWNLDFAHYKSLYTDAITPLREIPALQHVLRYQQKKCVLVQAFIAEILIHPAGLRPISEGVMTEEGYADAIRRMYPVESAAAQAEAPASPSKTRRGQRRAVFVEEAAAVATVGVVAAAAAAPNLSQSSTLSSRLRRSTRTQTLEQEDVVMLSQESTGNRRGRSRGTVTAATTTTEARVTRRGRSQDTTQSQPDGSRTRSASARGKRSASADESQPSRKGKKVVKKVVRKRKASRSATPAPPSAPPAAAASSQLSSSPAVIVPSLASHVHPSSHSVLATIVLRDLNGESELQVELHDPILAHANFDRSVGSVAATCATDPSAPRIFLGLSQVLPATAFTSAQWQSLLLAACSVPKVAKKRTDAQRIQAGIRQLHGAVLASLAPRRLLATVNMTRHAYARVENRLTTVFQAEPPAA